MEILTSYDEDEEMMMYSTDYQVNPETKDVDLSCDNQKVPECLHEPELSSRSQYYADFFTDHQHINASTTIQHDSDEEEIPFARVVEGCEDSSDSGIESAEDSGSSSLKHQSQHSKPRPQKFKPCASSTMMVEKSTSHIQSKQPTVGSVKRFSPKLCSTFLDEVTPKSGHYQPISEHFGRSQPISEHFGRSQPISEHFGRSQPISEHFGRSQPISEHFGRSQPISEHFGRSQPISEHFGRSQPISEDCSVYTWSIYDETNSASSLEEWDVSEINGHKLVVKPPNFCRTSSKKVEVFNQESQSLYHDEEDSFEVKHLSRTSTRVCLHSTKIDDDFHKVPEFKQPDVQRSFEHSNESTDRVVVNKKSLLKKFRKFTKSFHSHDKSSLQTLVNL